MATKFKMVEIKHLATFGNYIKKLSFIFLFFGISFNFFFTNATMSCRFYSKHFWGGISCQNAAQCLLITVLVAHSCCQF